MTSTGVNLVSILLLRIPSQPGGSRALYLHLPRIFSSEKLLAKAS